MSASTGGVCIISHATVVGAPTEIESAGFTIVFSLARGTVKKLLKAIRNKKKLHDKTLMLAKCKLNSIKTLVFQAVIGKEISHAEFITV